jgi:hypothetical protein
MAQILADRWMGVPAGASVLGTAAWDLPWLAPATLILLLIYGLAHPLVQGWAHAHFGTAATLNRNAMKLHAAGFTAEESLRHVQVQARAEVRGDYRDPEDAVEPSGYEAIDTSSSVHQLLRRAGLIRVRSRAA